MAGNKFNTEFSKPKVKEVTLSYKGLYGGTTKVVGTPKQIINHLIRITL